MRLKPILLVYIEPAPYIIDLVEKIESFSNQPIFISFLYDSLTQPWNAKLPANVSLLNTKWKRLCLLYHCFIKKKFSLIHVAGWSQKICLFIILLSRVVRVPVCVESDSHLVHTVAFWKRLLKSILYPLYFKFPSCFAPGGSQQKAYLQHYKVEEDKINIAHMTVDIKKIMKVIDVAQICTERASNNTPSNAVVFLYVGRLQSFKGVLKLIEAFKLINDALCFLWIVGDGPLRNELEGMCRDDKKICVFGRLSGIKLNKLYHAADVVVVPSSIEPWGLVVNEAMAAAKPVIVTDRLGCLEDLVRDKNTGIIYEYSDTNALKNAMITLASNTLMRKTMGMNAQKLISTWTIENEANNILTAWSKAI